MIKCSKKKLLHSGYFVLFFLFIMLIGSINLSLISARPIEKNVSVNLDCYIDFANPTTNFCNQASDHVGNDTTHIYRSYANYSFENFDSSILKEADIINASMVGRWSDSTGSGTLNITFYRITSTWGTTNLTWNAPPSNDSLMLSNYPMDSVFTEWKAIPINVTEFVKMINGTYTNYGFMLKSLNETKKVEKIFADSSGSYDSYFEVFYNGLIVVSPVNNQKITTSLSVVLNTTQSAYNQTLWYTWNKGITNYTLCTSSNDCQATITFPRNNSYNLTVYANKSDGTVTNVTVTNVTFGALSNVAPSVTNLIPNNSYFATHLINFTFNISDDNDYIKNISFYLDNVLNTSGYLNYAITPNTNITLNFSINNIAEGAHSWFVQGCDSDNACTNSSNFTIYIDLTPPKISIVSPANASNSSNVNLNVNYTVSDLYLNNCFWTGNGSTNPITCGQNITAQTWAQGWNIINITANDSAGNLNSSQVSFFIDNIAPTLTWIYPADDGLISSSYTNYFNYTISDGGVGLSKCWWSNTSGIANYSLASCGINITDIESTEGGHNITLWANDTLNNVASIIRYFNININNPSVTLYSPSNNFWFNTNNNINFNFSVTHANSIGQCQLWTNTTGVWALNQTNITGVSNAGVPYNFNPINISDGYYSWNVKCNESVGGKIGWYGVNRTFGVDTVAPVVLITLINSTPGSQNVLFNFTATDTNLNYCNYTLVNATSGALDSSVSPIPCNTARTITVSDYGTWNLTVYATDLANNYGWYMQQFTISALSPIIPGPGGGGGSVTVYLGNATWTMTTEQGSSSYDIQMTSFATRSQQILFTNLGSNVTHITLTCVGDLCQYLKLDSTNVTLPVDRAIQTSVGWTITIPRELQNAVYTATIIGTDEFGKTNSLTIKSTVGGLGILGTLIDKLFSFKNVNWAPIPYIIIFPIIFLIVMFGLYYGLFKPKKVPAGKVLSFFLGVVIGLTVLIFI